MDANGIAKEVNQYLQKYVGDPTTQLRETIQADLNSLLKSFWELRDVRPPVGRPIDAKPRASIRETKIGTFGVEMYWTTDFEEKMRDLGHGILDRHLRTAPEVMNTEFLMKFLQEVQAEMDETAEKVYEEDGKKLSQFFVMYDLDEQLDVPGLLIEYKVVVAE